MLQGRKGLDVLSCPKILDPMLVTFMSFLTCLLNFDREFIRLKHA